VYELFFEKYKKQKIKMLEIGVYDPRFPGASVKLWTTYFNDLTLIGLDINPEAKILETDNIKIFVGDQSNVDSLNECINEYGGEYDVIIDDGAHIHSHHVTSFVTLCPYLKKGGYYIIEDLHAFNCFQTKQWFKEKNIPFSLYCNEKLLIYEK
jgi:hypothetical protein